MKEIKNKKKKSPQWLNSPLNKRIGELLFKKLEAKEIKIEDFAKEFSISTEAVRLWTTGYARPDIDKIIKIAQYFNVSCDYLLGKTEIPNVDTNIQAIGDYTGLKEETIGSFKLFKEYNCMEIVNDLFSSDGFMLTIVKIGEYKLAKKDYEEDEKKYNPHITEKIANLEKSIEKDMLIQQKNNELEFRLWQISKAFIRIIEFLYK